MNQSSLRVFLAYATHDREKVDSLYRHLVSDGFRPWMAARDMLPGQDWAQATRQAILNSDAVLVCLSRGTGMNENSFQKKVFKDLALVFDYQEEVVLLIPVLLEPTKVPFELENFQAALLYEKGGYARLVASLEARQEQKQIKGAERELEHDLILSKVELYNICCFEKLTVPFELNGSMLWSLILGDNASGKSTLLRSIALGLSRESDAAFLLGLLPGPFVRDGANRGCITVHLRDRKKPTSTYTITTYIHRLSDTRKEIVRQETKPSIDFPWSAIFICGYGTNRSGQADSRYQEYSASNALKSLFSYDATLQNPELMLRRLGERAQRTVERKLLQILMLDGPEFRITYLKSGLEIRGPWGSKELVVLSDGYRSTSNWVLDFISWQLYADRLRDGVTVGGILLIDEIEQHLHPRWQRYVVQRLRTQFPETQIIATTHTPLVTAGIVDVDNSLVVKLEPQPDGTVEKQLIDRSLLEGKRADQVLASEAFGLATTRNPGSMDDLDRYAELLGKAKRTAQEEAELTKLRDHLSQTLTEGETVVAQAVRQAVDEGLKKILQKVSPEMVDFETRRQLKELFEVDSEK